MAFNSKQNHQLEKASFDYEAEDNAFLSAVQSCNAPMNAAVLKAAIELNLFEIIAKASAPPGSALVSAPQVASQLPTQQHHDLPHRVDRMLRLLATQSLLLCSTRITEDGGIERLYGLSPAGKYFVNADHGGSLASLTKFFSHKALVEPLLNFKEAILDIDNDLFKKVHGVPIYQYTEIDPTWNHVFNKAMEDTCIIEMKRVVEIYRGFEGISRLVDVGGGTGENLKLILSKYPLIKAINFDLPQVINHAQPYPGVEHIAGDMFSCLPGGDAIMLKAVCHNWSDEKCVQILSNCKKALTEKGKVIVVDLIMPEKIEATKAGNLVTGLDNLMFMHDGRERTEKEFESLCKGSGFSSFKLVCRAFSTIGVMEFSK